MLTTKILCFSSKNILTNAISISKRTIFSRSFNTPLSVNEMNNFLRNQNVQTIDTYTVQNVDRFDRLRIISPFNLHIHQLSAEQYPLMNRVFITLYGDSNLGFSKKEWNEFFDSRVIFDPKEGIVNIINFFTQTGQHELVNNFAQTLECHLEVPFQSGNGVYPLMKI